MAVQKASLATRAELLEQRIAENASGQQVDFAAWIFDRLTVSPGSRVLELCCGTGGQTLKLVELVGPSGQVVAMDVSREALEILTSRVAASDASRVSLVQATIDGFGGALTDAGVTPGFDLVFCAYGLYYSRDAVATLKEALHWLNPKGRIAVIGPFGPNNAPLFDLLVRSGVNLAEAVTSSSSRFMWDTVVPWGSLQFESLRIHTLVNPVRWSSPDRVLSYWQSSTFYSAEHRAAVETRLTQHFASHAAFVNEKWVMMVEMIDARR